jgi:hypothetical protein
VEAFSASQSYVTIKYWLWVMGGRNNEGNYACLDEDILIVCAGELEE